MCTSVSCQRVWGFHDILTAWTSERPSPAFVVSTIPGTEAQICCSLLLVWLLSNPPWTSGLFSVPPRIVIKLQQKHFWIVKCPINVQLWHCTMRKLQLGRVVEWSALELTAEPWHPHLLRPTQCTVPSIWGHSFFWEQNGQIPRPFSGKD